MTITLNGTTGVTTTGLTSNGIDDNANATAITIDSSEVVHVGGTSESGTGQVSLNGSGYVKARKNGTTGVFDRITTDGTILDLRKDGSTVGSIGVTQSGANIYYAGGATKSGVEYSNSAWRPWYDGARSDNVVDLGTAANRFKDIFATNGTIQTSDRNEKQDVAALTATEMLVAARISTGFKTFRWIDSVSDKGDNARTHTGVIAQDVQAAFIAEGLDAGDYALFTSATWWETQTDVPAVEADEDNDIEAADAYTLTDTFDTLDEAPDGATERTRMGIRYPELLAFVGSYNEQRFASIETRLAALEESP
jgi:hypothetical protein